jgi:5-methylthioadenosine/S-adenosylhomocysteine deaminase
MAYTPIGNAKTGRIAPALQLAEAGASVTLCTDTFSGDLFEAMRWGLSMQRVRTEGAVLSARTALRWACENGARALGLWGQVGSLEPGKKADIVVIDATAPTAAPVVDGYGILVYSVSGPNVHTVLVDGQIVVENGQLVTGDGPAIVRDAQGVAERLWRRVGRESIVRVSE